MNRNRSDLLTRLAILLDRLPEERVQTLLGMEDDALLAGNADVKASSKAKQSAPKPVHKDIRIEFELGGQKFEAVGFLKTREESILGWEGTRRVNNGHIVRNNVDWRFVYEHRSELPWELEAYWLMTARPHPRSAHDVFDLGHDDDTGWYDFLCSLDSQWDRSMLVLRRRV